MKKIKLNLRGLWWRPLEAMMAGRLQSIGTGVAIQIATEYPVGAVILQASFPSLVDVGKTHYPFLPINLFLKARYASYKKIKKITVPKLFIHGEQDRIIPIKLGKRLYEEAPQPKQLQIYHHAGHNNLPDPSERVIKFLKEYKICQSKGQ